MGLGGGLRLQGEGEGEGDGGGEERGGGEVRGRVGGGGGEQGEVNTCPSKVDSAQKNILEWHLEPLTTRFLG